MLNTNDSTIKSISLVGDKLCCWVVATMLRATLANLKISIRIIATSDSTDVLPIVTSSNFVNKFQLLSMIKVPLNEFVSRCDATFRIGDGYCGGENNDIDFIHTFSSCKHSFGRVPVHELLARLHSKGENISLAELSLAAQMAKSGKIFPIDESIVREYFSALGVNFSRSAFIELFEEKANLLAIDYIETALLKVNIDDSNEKITSIVSRDGEFNADFFIDCTGHSRSLIGNLSDVTELGEIFEKVEQTNEAVKCQSPVNKFFLQDDVIEHQVSLSQLNQSIQYSIKPDVINHAKPVKLTLMKKTWAGNCLALGHSMANIANLALNEIDLLQEAVLIFVDHFPRSSSSVLLAQQFNRVMSAKINQYWQLHFLILQANSLTKLTDNCLVNFDIDSSKSLINRLELYRETGRVLLKDHESWSEHYWVSFLMGLKYWPLAWSPECEMLELSTTSALLVKEKQRIQEYVASLPEYSQVLENLKH